MPEPRSKSGDATTTRRGRTAHCSDRRRSSTQTAAEDWHNRWTETGGRSREHRAPRRRGGLEEHRWNVGPVVLSADRADDIVRSLEPLFFTVASVRTDAAESATEQGMEPLGLEPDRFASVPHRDAERARHLPFVRTKHRPQHERLVSLSLRRDLDQEKSRVRTAVGWEPRHGDTPHLGVHAVQEHIPVLLDVDELLRDRNVALGHGNWLV